jgi:hypothetical protein
LRIDDQLATRSDGLLLADILGDEAVQPIEKPIGVGSRSYRRVAPRRAYQNLLNVKAAAASAIAEARLRILIAARWQRDEQLGTALVRLNDIYRRALSAQDAKTALAVQKELNRLLDLYRPAAKPPPAAPGDRPSSPAAVDEMAAARAHLAPLGLGNESTPLAELCRLAVLRILRG